MQLVFFLAVLLARLFSKFLVKGDDTPFVMELPPYRMPTAKSIFRHTWEKGAQYLKKNGRNYYGRFCYNLVSGILSES